MRDRAIIKRSKAVEASFRGTFGCLILLVIAQELAGFTKRYFCFHGEVCLLHIRSSDYLITGNDPCDGQRGFRDVLRATFAKIRLFPENIHKLEAVE